MLATLEIVDILDNAEHISQMIIQSEEMKNFQEAKQRLHEDKEAQRKIAAFQRIKDHYEDVQRFGRYHPDYSNIMKEVRLKKREMDMDDSVATFKRAETELQALLDDVSSIIGKSVSPYIKVPRDGAVFTDSGCGCGSGGSCGCAS
ncbi:YlbF family regulator [Salirhabdus salicampi]|uniref:YlbF family regulator n=1 Tax=Salirhabdus salicampi TaxID=476102 RepID=UPI0020C5496C|nr:YlbF family regulator [Salirhabdus salicampi]MCP8616631.1 YlbF family regulator [Salirhabdus salicampi]